MKRRGTRLVGQVLKEAKYTLKRLGCTPLRVSQNVCVSKQGNPINDRFPGGFLWNMLKKREKKTTPKTGFPRKRYPNL